MGSTMNSSFCLWCRARGRATVAPRPPGTPCTTYLAGCPDEWQQPPPCRSATSPATSRSAAAAGRVPGSRDLGGGLDVHKDSRRGPRLRPGLAGLVPPKRRATRAASTTPTRTASRSLAGRRSWTRDVARSQQDIAATHANGLSYAARGFGYYINGNCYACHGGSDKPPAWLGEDYYRDSQLRGELDRSRAAQTTRGRACRRRRGVAQEGCNRKEDCLVCGPTGATATSGTIFANETLGGTLSTWRPPSGAKTRPLLPSLRYATSDDFPGRPFGSLLKELDAYTNDPIEARIMAGQTTSNEDSAVRSLTLEVFGCLVDPAPVCGDGAVTPPRAVRRRRGQRRLLHRVYGLEPRTCKSDGTCASADVVPPRGEDLPGKEEVEQLPAWVRVADVVFDDHFRSLETATGDGAACSNNAPDAVMDACPGDLVRFDARGRAVCGPPLEHTTRTDPYSVFVAGPRGTPVAGFKGRVTAVALGAHDGFLNTSWLHTDVSAGTEMYPNDHAKSTGLEGRFVDGITLTVGGTDTAPRAPTSSRTPSARQTTSPIRCWTH